MNLYTKLGLGNYYGEVAVNTDGKYFWMSLQDWDGEDSIIPISEITYNNLLYDIKPKGKLIGSIGGEDIYETNIKCLPSNLRKQ